MARTCDWLIPPANTRCGKRSTNHLDGVQLEADLCKAHLTDLQDALLLVGFTRKLVDPEGSVRVDWKDRRVHVAASGARFSAAEARVWLMEQDMAASKGRLSRAQLRAYAEKH